MEILNDRVQIITEILRLLVTMISHQRGYLVREDPALYETNPD
jgi:CHASE3 domain sensor protein